jgi:3-oxoacyl-[acyl-carrier protein] reductase
MFSLKGRKALVTGATGGIGEHIARSLHHQGATVILSGRRLDKLKEIADSLGGPTHILECDLANEADVNDLVSKATELEDGLDILVNNAGITRDGLILRMKDEDWQEVMKVNLESAFRLSRAAVKVMMKNRFGRIINITSIVGVTGNPGQVNYCAAKAGLIGFSKALAAEIAGRNVTVNCVAPGFIHSPMTDVLPEAQKEHLLKGIPMGRMGNPDEIAAAVAFLASDNAGYITGQTLHVNGGMAMI